MSLFLTIGRLVAEGGEVSVDSEGIVTHMTMVDVTDVPHVREGDEVIIFGNDITVIELANKINTIAYEILTSVSERVKRVFYQL